VRDALLADPQISDTLALGARAFDVIRAALRGKLIHVLVTDEGIATRLLEET
jgi:DNA-binding transcriptional regulator LsrR (DeoR family)